MKTLAASIVALLLSGCVSAGGNMVKLERRDGKIKGRFEYPYAAFHIHKETQDQYYADYISSLQNGLCKGKTFRLVGEASDDVHLPMLDFECE